MTSNPTRARRPPTRRIEPETVADALERRRNCRFGLGGLCMRHVPSAREFVCEGSVWSPESTLLLYATDGRRRVKIRAEECILLSAWPIVCCRPRPRPKED
jgi:hypothetical protein